MYATINRLKVYWKKMTAFEWEIDKNVGLTSLMMGKSVWALACF